MHKRVFAAAALLSLSASAGFAQEVQRGEKIEVTGSSIKRIDAETALPVQILRRRDYVGAEARAMYGAPTRSGGGKTWSASGFAGFGDIARDRYNVTLGAGYEKIDPIMGSDRPYAHNINVAEGNDLSSTIAFPGNILSGPTFGRLSSPAFPNCGPTGIVSPFFIGNANTGTACRFENSPFLSVQSGSEQTHALLGAHYVVSSGLEAYLESGFTRNKFSYVTQPVPISEATALPATNPYNAFLANLIATQYPTLPAGLRRFSTAGNTLVLLAPGSPFYPTAFVASLGLPANQPIAFRYRDFANGQRHTEDSADNIRVVAGVKGTVAAWDYDSAFLYSESKAASNLQAGYPLYSRFLPILDSGIVNPFGPTTDPTTLSAVQGAEFRGDIYTSKTSVTSLDAKASRDLLQMRGGSLPLAVRPQGRQERFVFSPSHAYQIGDIAGFGGNILPVDRKRHVASVYAETAI